MYGKIKMQFEAWGVVPDDSISPEDFAADFLNGRVDRSRFDGMRIALA